MSSERVFVLGAGRAGLGLARALRASGVRVVGVHGRHALEGSNDISIGTLPPSLHEASATLVAVRDTQLEGALRELASAKPAPSMVVLHASGIADPSALDELRLVGHPAGTFHPLVPLVDPARAPEMLRGATIGIDGDTRAREVAYWLAGRLGARSLDIPAGEKGRYHAAAVLASNFPAVLLSLAEELLARIGVAPADARLALRPLLLSAAENLRQRSGAEAMTGPIVRGDVDTIRSHLEALIDDPIALDVYRSLSRAAVEVASAGGTDPGAMSRIRALLG